MLINNFFLKIPLPEINDLKPLSLLGLMKKDKKTNYKGINFILIKDMGKPYIDKINDDVIVNYIEGFHEHSSCKWTKS